MDVERLGKRELGGSPLDIFSLAIRGLPHSVDNVRHHDADVKMGHPRCCKSTSFSCHQGEGVMGSYPVFLTSRVNVGHIWRQDALACGLFAPKSSKPS